MLPQCREGESVWHKWLLAGTTSRRMMVAERQAWVIQDQGFGLTQCQIRNLIQLGGLIASRGLNLTETKHGKGAQSEPQEPEPQRWPLQVGQRDQPDHRKIGVILHLNEAAADTPRLPLRAGRLAILHRTINKDAIQVRACGESVRQRRDHRGYPDPSGDLMA